MPNVKSGHLVENRINAYNHSVILLDHKKRGFPALTFDEMVEDVRTRRMLAFLIKRGVVVETQDGRLRVGATGQRYADMFEARESKKERHARGELDIAVVFPMTARDVAVFHPRTKFGAMLVEHHPLTAKDSKVPIEAVAAIVSHMRNDGAIIENRTRPGYRGGRPSTLTADAA